jgi:hypothetical protein
MAQQSRDAPSYRAASTRRYEDDGRDRDGRDGDGRDGDGRDGDGLGIGLLLSLGCWLVLAVLVGLWWT